MGMVQESWKDKSPEWWRRKANSLNARVVEQYDHKRGHVTGGQLRTIFKFARYQCQKCPNKDHLSIDHVLPLSQGGLHIAQNLQVLCVSCNSHKGSEKPEEYIDAKEQRRVLKHKRAAYQRGP